MDEVHIIEANPEVFNLYLKQKTEFQFQQKTDNDFLLFLLDTAVRVISIVQHLSPVIEAVSTSPTMSDYRERDHLLPLSKRPCLREPIMVDFSGGAAPPSSVPTAEPSPLGELSLDLIDQQISHHSSEYEQLEKELETLTQSLCEVNTEQPAATTAPTQLSTTAAGTAPPTTTTANDSTMATGSDPATSPPATSCGQAAVKEVIKQEILDATPAVLPPGSGTAEQLAEDTGGGSANASDTERLTAAVLHSVGFLGSLSQLTSIPGPALHPPHSTAQLSTAPSPGLKTYDCSFCDYKTLDKLEYMKHIREHTGDRTIHCCRICDYQTDIRSNLAIHIQTHTKGRLYHCKLCSFRTSRRMYLQEHMESHAVDEKPYVCLLCDYRTARKANLGIHMGSQKHIASVMKAKMMGTPPPPSPAQTAGGAGASPIKTEID